MMVIIDDDNCDGHGYDEDPYLFHIRFKSPLERIGDAEGA